MHVTTAIRDDVAFLQALQAALNKQTTGRRKSPEDPDAAVRRLVSRAIVAEGPIKAESAADAAVFREAEADTDFSHLLLYFLTAVAVKNLSERHGPRNSNRIFDSANRFCDAGGAQQ